MRVLWDTTQSSTSLPFFFLQFHDPHSLFLSLFLFLHWSIISKLLIQGSCWWWSSFFHGLFPSGWRLLPLLLCLLLHLHGGKSPLKDLIQAQRSRLHWSPTSKLPSLFFHSKNKWWKENYIFVWNQRNFCKIFVVFQVYILFLPYQKTHLCFPNITSRLFLPIENLASEFSKSLIFFHTCYNSYMN